jgi:hypothetical protein
VSARTVKRDVADLQQAGVPIWAQGGRGGGDVLDAATSLPPVAFTVGEATAIAVALHPQPGLRDRGRRWLFAWCRRQRAGYAVPVDRVVGAWPTTEEAPTRDIHAVFRDIPEEAFALSLSRP